MEGYADMKSIIFVLLMHAHSGDTTPVGAFESIEQCRLAQVTAGQNQAADYSCESVPVAGEWSRKNARYVQPSTFRVADDTRPPGN
jgi:hypothetical protein